MLNKLLKTVFTVFSVVIFSICLKAQLPVTIPWSSSVNQTFGNGSANPGQLTSGYTDLGYVTYSPPGPGSYSVAFSENDAGHIFFGPFPTTKLVPGYKMVASYDGSFANKIIYADTARNLCHNTRYLFWAGINNTDFSSCLTPDLTLDVETLGGTVIASFPTGPIGGPHNQDNYAWPPGYYDRVLSPKVPFYGGEFQVPAGQTDVIVKIIANPSAANPSCAAKLELDNIIVMPIGPDITISSPKYPGGWITGSCFQGDVPLELNGKIESGYLQFGTPNYITTSYTNPGFQWQQSLDNGYTWTDIAGESSIDISHLFNIPDTFLMRLRVSEIGDIRNPNCSNVSNIMQVQVDDSASGFSLASNSPICTDGFLKFQLTQGAGSYQINGPNGYSDNSAFPGIYHPTLSDSGWYYSAISTFGGCKTVDSIFVKVYGLDSVNYPDRSICYGDTVHLHAIPGVSYDWQPTAGLNNPTTMNPIASPVTTTHYRGLVTDSNGCHAPVNITLILRDSVLQATINGPDVACPQDLIVFRDTSLGQIQSWQWSFGNGATSDAKDPAPQQFPPDGVYFPVRLTIVDTAGCVDTTTKLLRAVNNCYIAVPNAFTPNNDGKNDYLYPLNAYKATDLDFKIFDRWGHLVYETKDWTKKWDGKIGGVPQPTGVYVWMLSYNDENHRRISLKGTTVLIR